MEHKPDITSADHDDMYKKQSLPDVAFVYLNRMISLGDDRFTAGLSKSMNDTTIERSMQRDMTDDRLQQRLRHFGAQESGGGEPGRRGAKQSAPSGGNGRRVISVDRPLRLRTAPRERPGCSPASLPPEGTYWPFSRCIGPDGPPVGGVQQLRLPWFSRKIYV